MTNIANASIQITKGGLGMGDWLLTRDPNRILDYAPVQKMNDELRTAGLVVWIISMGLVLTKHVLGPFVGAEPAALLYAFPTTVAMGFAGYFNRPLLRLIVNMVHGLLGVIVNTSLKEAIEPNLSIAGFATDVLQQAGGMLAAPFVAALVAIVGLLLILKMWAQLGWLFILTAPAPIYISATGAPFIGKYSSAWWRSWLGTLIDPILTLAGLKIAAAGLGFFDGEVPLLWKQLYSLVILLPLLATPGWHPGAYGGQGIDTLIGLMLFRLMRLTGNTNAAQPTPQQTPMTPTLIPNPAAVGGYGVLGGSGTGGGTAAAWWKTGRWTPGGWA